MNDLRHFLRYVTPGILYGVETLVFVWVLFPSWVEERLPSWLGAATGGTAAGILLVSAALGYFFATVHHWLHWYAPVDRNIINHSKMIKVLQEKRWIPDAQEGTNKEANAKLEAFHILISEWHQRLQKESPIGNADGNAAHLGDIAHSAGTARVASLFAILTTVIIRLLLREVDVPLWRWVIMFSLGIAAFCLFNNTYRKVGRMAGRFYDTVLYAALEMEREKRRKETHSNPE